MRHHTKRPQHNGIRKFTAGRIACTAERDRTDMSLSSRHSLSTPYRCTRARAFNRFARLGAVFASAKWERYVVRCIGNGLIRAQFYFCLFVCF